MLKILTYISMPYKLDQDREKFCYPILTAYGENYKFLYKELAIILEYR